MNNDLLNFGFVKTINRIALNAGSKILEIYQTDFAIQAKDDSSPLTEADLASHNIIVNSLAELTPDLPILSEESNHIPWATRSEWETYWLIDPLDGTKEFIKRNGEFTVNIALIHKGKSVLGVVYAPVLKQLYFASQVIGAWKQKDKQSEKKISVASHDAKIDLKRKKIKVVGSRSHHSELVTEYLQQFDSYEMLYMGSSLKICLIAEGKADIYPRLGPTSEWDTAAAQAVVEAAGGICLNYETNAQLDYNTKDSLLNPFFIVKGFSN